MLIVTWLNEIAMPPLADNHNGVPARDPQGHSRRLGRLGRSGVFALTLALGLLAAGFMWFVWRVPADEVTMSGEADAIVALTGGASRIADAIELLASGRGKRLLISGANRSTTAQEISRTVQAALERHPLVERFWDDNDSHLGATVAVIVVSR